MSTGKFAQAFMSGGCRESASSIAERRSRIFSGDAGDAAIIANKLDRLSRWLKVNEKEIPKDIEETIGSLLSGEYQRRTPF